MTGPQEPPVTDWYCPRCRRTDQTRILGPHSQYHQCAAMGGAWVPFVQAGVHATLIVNHWEDYVGTGQLVTCDGNGRPVSSITTERDDGQDCHVYAPCAVADLRT